jgi:hypothetical protein
MGLVDKLIAKYEVYRLEQRYTRREKRTTFTSGARYVDGEYVYGDLPVAAKSQGHLQSSWTGRRVSSFRSSYTNDSHRTSRYV